MAAGVCVLRGAPHRAVWLNMLPARRVCEMNNETFQELNLKVDVEGQDPADVAYDWMVEEGFISEN